MFASRVSGKGLTFRVQREPGVLGFIGASSLLIRENQLSTLLPQALHKVGCRSVRGEPAGLSPSSGSGSLTSCWVGAALSAPASSRERARTAPLGGLENTARLCSSSRQGASNSLGIS